MQLARKYQFAMAAVVAGVLTSTGALAEADKFRWGVSAVLSGGHMLAPLLDMDKEVQAKHNIEIELTDFNGGGTNCIAAVLAEAVDVCQNGSTIGMNAIAQGADLKGFMQQAGQIVEITLAKSVIEKTGIGPEAPIEDRVKALKGLRIASPGPGTTNYYMIQDILAAGGLSLQDIQFQPLTDIQAMNASLMNGRVDAGFWSVGGMSPSQADGSGVRFIGLAAGDFPELRDAPNIAVFAASAYVEANKEQLRRVQLAFIDVVAKLKADPVGYTQAFKDRYLPELPQETWEKDVPLIAAAFYDDAEGTKEGWEFWVTRFSQDTTQDYSAAAYDKAYVRLTP